LGRDPEADVGSWGTRPDSWERATTVVFSAASRDVVTEFTIDLRARVVRRVHRVSQVSAKEASIMSTRTTIITSPAMTLPRLSRTETTILYESPTCEVDEHTLADELAAPPW